MHVAGSCAAMRCEVASEADKEAIVAIGGAPNGRFLHCLGDRTGIKCPCPLPSELGRGHCRQRLYQPLFLRFYPCLRCHLSVTPLAYKKEAHAHVEGVRRFGIWFHSLGARSFGSAAKPHTRSREQELNTNTQSSSRSFISPESSEAG